VIKESGNSDEAEESNSWRCSKWKTWRNANEIQ